MQPSSGIRFSFSAAMDYGTETIGRKSLSDALAQIGAIVLNTFHLALRHGEPFGTQM